MSYPPIYGAPVIGAYGSIFDQQAEQLRAQDAAAKELALSGARLLKALFPTVDPQYIDALQDAFVGYVCCGTDRQLKQLEEQKAQAARFCAPSDEERLVALVDERDREIAKMVEIDAAFDKLPDGLGEPMKLALKQQIGNSLEWKDKEISALQDKIERAHAESPSTETIQESADV